MNEPTYQMLLKKEEFRKFIDKKEKESLDNSEINNESNLSNEVNYYEEELKRVINSKTYKIGNIIMLIPRKIKQYIYKIKR